ncbi:hypothetical protein AAMO2058_001167600 [Amorphochlora amoebiformis]|mmetsp:Transcript_26334/g.41657  ORF Transcript_26334/g.41657 Transcript_26334/m.41657 type:complete len:324 (-) Transcript_26334:228-1199(-)
MSQEHEAKIIDGKAIAKIIRGEIKEAVDALVKEHKVTPGLATVLVGNRPDSATYVRFKKRAAKEVGFYSVDVKLDQTVSEEDLIKEVHKLAADPKVHGILVQLPLPKHINEYKVLSSIPVEKDVDGFSAFNIGNMCLKGGDPPLAIPCTPAGCIELLQRSGIEPKGLDAVVIGRSNIVGMPMAHLLRSMDATVTVCHSRTKDIKGHVSRADIVVAAIGKPEFIKGEWLKKGAVVIDVGINSKEDATKKRGYRLVGDVEFANAKKVAGFITPVPGGVGPMTIAMLLWNTLNLTRHALKLDRLPLRTNRCTYRDVSKASEEKEKS